jgi:hypothetical protein
MGGSLLQEACQLAVVCKVLFLMGFVMWSAAGW